MNVPNRKAKTSRYIVLYMGYMNKDYNGYHGLYMDGQNLYNSSLKIWYRLQDVFTSDKKVYKKEVSSAYVRLQNKSIDWINSFVILALIKSYIHY